MSPPRKLLLKNAPGDNAQSPLIQLNKIRTDATPSVRHDAAYFGVGDQTNKSVLAVPRVGIRKNKESSNMSIPQSEVSRGSSINVLSEVNQPPSNFAAKHAVVAPIPEGDDSSTC